jgi:hypothetical protein
MPRRVGFNTRNQHVPIALKTEPWLDRVFDLVSRLRGHGTRFSV